jgi:hypothetical protein
MFVAKVGGLWRHGGLAQLFSFSRRLAGIAADLMQTDGTLLHHDQALFKEPGGGHTPWHCDQQYWPLDADSERPATSCWVPLVDCPLEMGPLQVCIATTVEYELQPPQHLTPRALPHAVLASAVCEGLPPRRTQRASSTENLRRVGVTNLGVSMIVAGRALVLKAAVRAALASVLPRYILAILQPMTSPPVLCADKTYTVMQLR